MTPLKTAVRIANNYNRTGYFLTVGHKVEFRILRTLADEKSSDKRQT